MSDDKYIFRPQTKKTLAIIAVVGIVLIVLGVFTADSGGHEDESHALTTITDNLLASVEKDASLINDAAGEESHGSAVWVKRLFANLWLNNVYFTGFAIIGLFFVAIQYFTDHRVR